MAEKRKVHKAEKSLAIESSSINPKTDRVWSLVDPEAQQQVTALRGRLQDPAGAIAILQSAGLLTPKGKWSKRYGG